MHGRDGGISSLFLFTLAPNSMSCMGRMQTPQSASHMALVGKLKLLKLVKEGNLLPLLTFFLVWMVVAGYGKIIVTKTDNHLSPDNFQDLLTFPHHKALT